MIETTRKWTIPVLTRRGDMTPFTMKVMYAYVGLELATSLFVVDFLKELWRDELFVSQKDFSMVMERDQFLILPVSLRFSPEYY